jgi:hypothetical protein
MKSILVTRLKPVTKDPECNGARLAKQIPDQEKKNCLVDDYVGRIFTPALARRAAIGSGSLALSTISPR